MRTLLLFCFVSTSASLGIQHDLKFAETVSSDILNSFDLKTSPDKFLLSIRNMTKDKSKSKEKDLFADIWRRKIFNGTKKKYSHTKERLDVVEINFSRIDEKLNVNILMVNITADKQ